jgi:prepilin-type N-terminal cleavage/methylation domain-containing protein
MKNSRGFTLMELMITMAIIGILALVSIPLYRDYIIRVRVTEALLEFEPFRKELLEIFLASEGSASDQIMKLRENISVENQANGIKGYTHDKYINGNSLDRVNFYFIGKDYGGWLEIKLHLKEGIFPAKMENINYLPKIAYRMNYPQNYIGADCKPANVAKQGNGPVTIFCGQSTKFDEENWYYSSGNIPRRYLPRGCYDALLFFTMPVKNGAENF